MIELVANLNKNVVRNVTNVKSTYGKILSEPKIFVFTLKNKMSWEITNKPTPSTI